jgi:predicted hydrocarbon binding protein
VSLLSERKTHGSVPRLDGREVLTGPNPEMAKIKGVVFAARKQFLTAFAGEEGFESIVATLKPKTAAIIRTPLASAWYDFAALIELDRAIYNAFHVKQPNILALAGAASAEYGIGKVYKALDSAELVKFLENEAMFHSQFQKFGNVEFQQTPRGGRMVYSGYPVYSPIYCASAIGFFLEAILRHGGHDPAVTETRCQCLGQPSCTFELTWT